MDAGRFIARRLSQRGADPKDGDRLSGVSHNIAWISVALSVAVMIVAVAVVGGFKSEIRAKATGFMGSVILCQPGQSPINEHFPFTCNLSYSDKLSSMKGVESVCPVAYRSGLIRNDGEIGGVYFKGVDSLYDFAFFEKSLSEGSLPDYSGTLSSDVMISSRLAAKLGLEVGDNMTTYFVGGELKARVFRICGLFDAQLDEIDNTFAIVDIRHIQRLAGWSPDEVSAIEVRISPRADIDRMRHDIEELEFLQGRDEDPSLFAISVKRIYSYLFDWLAVLDLNVVMILVLMMAVAGFNMISAILIILFRKISMIGVLKSVGMTDRQVTRVFLLRSARIVGKGMLWGNVLAIGLCLIQMWTKVLTLDPANYFVKYVPIRLDPGQVLLIDVISCAVIMLILCLSAIFVAKESPDKSLRTL